jgi:hypothetical protein
LARKGRSLPLLLRSLVFVLSVDLAAQIVNVSDAVQMPNALFRDSDSCQDLTRHRSPVMATFVDEE